MDGDSSNANVCGWFEGLLVNWNLFKIVQSLPAIDHSVTKIHEASKDALS